MRRPHLTDVFIADDHHHVPGQDRRGGPISGMDRGLAPPQRRLVHGVVVNEGEIMKEFERGRHLPGIVFDGAEELVTHQTKHRPDTFATELQEIVGWIIQTIRIKREMAGIEPRSKGCGQFFETLHGQMYGFPLTAGPRRSPYFFFFRVFGVEGPAALSRLWWPALCALPPPCPAAPPFFA